MDFVDFNLAKKLKEKGFPQRTFGEYDMLGACYFEDGRFYEKGCITEVARAYTAPTIAQVLKWLREEKNIYCLPWFERGVDMWFYAICKPSYGCEFPEFMSKSDYDTYEQAAIAGIAYVLDKLI
jgi:hypothetical protein